MSLFRSEEHVRRWTNAKDYSVGAVVGIAQVWRLAKAWYGDPRAGLAPTDARRISSRPRLRRAHRGVLGAATVAATPLAA
ncbi:MAG: hypothetical protein ACJ796_01070 [Gemmatimonadaceae bacterium]